MTGQPVLHSETMSVSKQQNNGLGYGSVLETLPGVCKSLSSMTGLYEDRQINRNT